MVLGTLINHPELLGRDTLYELRGIVARYPYFQTARLLMLKNLYLLHDPDFGAELRRSVLYVSDRRALCRLIEGYVDRVMDESEVAEAPTIDRTMSLIDAFLGTLPEDYGSDKLMPVDAVGDYASRFLLEEESAPHIAIDCGAQDASTGEDSVLRALGLMSQNEAVSEASVPTEVEVTETPVSDTEMLDESYFTETLAKIYIKQRKYSRALEIIKSLYLQFPEKNAYFADQIRFLEKLIINNNFK
jgi:hypothetical protein